MSPTTTRGVFVALVSSLIATAACSQSPKSAAERSEANRDRAAEELTDATQVVDEMNAIPSRQRQRARCVVVVPSLVRAGFVVGGRHGDGVVTCRTDSGWSAPAFVTITGGSAGFQIGVESSDLVMLVASERGMARLFRTRFALGADASAAAGPVGEAAQAGTDASLTAEVVTYARSRGLFAGAELSGAVVEQDRGALVSAYGPGADVHAILSGEVPPPREAARFVGRIASAFPAAPVAPVAP
jgi:lipid-binding SYLF domain-containing protein